MKARNRIKKSGGKWITLIILILLLIAMTALAVWLSEREKAPEAEAFSTAEHPDATQTAVENADSTPLEQTMSEATAQSTDEPTTEAIVDSTESASVTPTRAPEKKPVKTSGSGNPNEAAQWVESSGSSVISVAPVTLPPEEEETEPEPELELAQITCDQFSLFNGQFVEDGRDELVYDVAAILVTNHSDQYLEIATISYKIDGKTASFVVTGLHPEHSAWVMEENRMTATADSNFEYVGIATAFRDDVTTSTDKVSISVEGNMMTAKNNTNAAIEDVFVYYKVKHDDGNYLGGITYRVDFGTLEPGTPVTKLAGHFDTEKAEVVRISWKTD